MECGGQAADAAGHERGARGPDEAPHPDPISAPQLCTDENSFYVADIYRVIKRITNFPRLCAKGASCPTMCLHANFFFCGSSFFSLQKSILDHNKDLIYSIHIKYGCMK